MIAQPAVAPTKPTSAIRIARPRPARRANSPTKNCDTPSETTNALSVSCSSLPVARMLARRLSSAGRYMSIESWPSITTGIRINTREGWRFEVSLMNVVDRK